VVGIESIRIRRGFPAARVLATLRRAQRLRHPFASSGTRRL